MLTNSLEGLVPAVTCAFDLWKDEEEEDDDDDGSKDEDEEEEEEEIEEEEGNSDPLMGDSDEDEDAVPGEGIICVRLYFFHW